MSTTKEDMEDAFNASLKKTERKFGETAALEADGWEESSCPSGHGWHFTHPDFPGFVADWTPGHEPHITKY